MQRITGIGSADASWLIIVSDESINSPSPAEFYKTVMRETLAHMWDSDAETMSQIDSLIKASSPTDIGSKQATTRVDAILQYFQGFELNGESVVPPSVAINSTDKFMCFHNEWDMFSLVISNNNSNTFFLWETTA